jgi:hypothetical protein
LYNNFFEFERRLKELLIIKGFDVDDFVHFFEFRAKKYPKDGELCNNKKEELIKERDNYPFDSLDIRNLLEFCYSSFHEKNGSERRCPCKLLK